MNWFTERVLPGLITGIPYMLIGGTGLWWNLRQGKKHTERITKSQTQEIVSKLGGPDVL